jgi:hypothetical protein
MTGARVAGTNRYRPGLCARPRALCAAAAVAGLLLVPGCTSGGDGDVTATPEVTASPSVAASPSAAPSPSPSPPEPMEFVYAPPDSPCLPAAQLTFLPSAAEHEYVSVEPEFGEENVGGGWREYCAYRLAEIGDGRDMVLDDHVFIRMDYAVYRQWGDSSWVGAYPELPVWSDDLERWRLFDITRDPEVRWEGCGPATPCEDGEEPTVRTYGLRAWYSGHVGNLELDVRIEYIAEHLPADVEDRLVEIFRDLVFAVVDSKERVQ